MIGEPDTWTGLKRWNKKRRRPRVPDIRNSLQNKSGQGPHILPEWWTKDGQ